MTRTRRIFNKKPLEGGPGFRGWFVTEVRKEILEDEKKLYNKSLRPDDDIGFSKVRWVSYHPYRQLCMGNCPYCSRGKQKIFWQRDSRYKRFAQLEIENSGSEDINWDEITKDPLSSIVDLWKDYEEWLDCPPFDEDDFWD
jgi:hypothetical protein